MRLSPADLAAVDAIMAPADAALAAAYPGDSGARQPVHTVYVPADRVAPGLAAGYGRAARAALDEHAPDPAALARSWAPTRPGSPRRGRCCSPSSTPSPSRTCGSTSRTATAATPRREDEHAVAAVRALAGGEGPPYWGVRFKSFEAATRARGLRTLDLVLGTVLECGPLPAGFGVTLPKVTSVEQVRALVETCGRLERAYGLDTGRLGFEVQVETPQVILGPDGTATVARLVHAAEGRCTGLHFGTYDYSAALGIAAGYQAMDHPVADHAKHVMQLAAAGTGVAVSDGSTNVLPVGSTAAGARRLGAALPARPPSLERGLLPGLGPAPGPAPDPLPRHLRVLPLGLDAAAGRLRAYLDGAAGSVLDEPATAKALAGFLRRAGLRA